MIGGKRAVEFEIVPRHSFGVVICKVEMSFSSSLHQVKLAFVIMNSGMGGEIGGYEV